MLQASAEHEYLETLQQSLTEHMEDPHWQQRHANLPNQWDRAGVALQLMQEGMALEGAMQTLEDQMRVRPLTPRPPAAADSCRPVFLESRTWTSVLLFRNTLEIKNSSYAAILDLYIGADLHVVQQHKSVKLLVMLLCLCVRSECVQASLKQLHDFFRLCDESVHQQGMLSGRTLLVLTDGLIDRHQ